MKNNRLISTINIIPLKLRIYRILRSILIWFLFAGTVNLILSYTLHTPKSYNINKENISLVNKIDDLNDKVDELNDYTENISFRYNNVYKALFGLSDFRQQIQQYIQRQVSSSNLQYLQAFRRYRTKIIVTFSFVGLDQLTCKPKGTYIKINPNTFANPQR